MSACAGDRPKTEICDLRMNAQPPYGKCAQKDGKKIDRQLPDLDKYVAFPLNDYLNDETWIADLQKENIDLKRQLLNCK